MFHECIVGVICGYCRLWIHLSMNLIYSSTQITFRNATFCQKLIKKYELKQRLCYKLELMIDGDRGLEEALTLTSPRNLKNRRPILL